MNEYEHNPDKLDQLLDDSLAEYSQAEPLAGLEDRILARLEHAAEEQVPWYEAAGWQRWGWALTAVVLAAGIALGMFLVTRPGEDIDYVADGETIEVKSGPVEPQIAALPPRIPVEVIRRAFERRPLPTGLLASTPQVAGEEPAPNAEVFPAPAPLSEQERLALSYARMSPGLRVIRAEPGIKAIEVKPLEIAPLRVEITGGSGG